jgi:hypothetical protein
MSTNFHSAQRRGFAKGSRQQIYTCRCCSRKTRPTGTGDNDGVELCEECYTLAGEENALSDNGEFYGPPQEVLALIAAVEKKGGNVSCWSALKTRAESARPRTATEILAAYPLEDFNLQLKPDEHPLFGANSWMLTVGDVRRARKILAAVQQ